MRIKTRLIAVVCVLPLISGGPAFAFSSGVATTTFLDPAAGCNHVACHGGGLPPTVTLTGPATVLPDSINEYLLTILEVGSQSHGGLNASADLGILTVGGASGSGTKSLVGTGGLMEVTHMGAKASVAGETLFSFLWQAPSSGSATLRAWGNAVNLSSTSMGDLASLATLAVAVATPVPTPSPTPMPTQTPEVPPPAVPTMNSLAGPAVLVLLLLLSGAWVLFRRESDH